MLDPFYAMHTPCQAQAHTCFLLPLHLSGAIVICPHPAILLMEAFRQDQGGVAWPIKGKSPKQIKCAGKAKREPSCFYCRSAFACRYAAARASGTTSPAATFPSAP